MCQIRNDQANEVFSYQRRIANGERLFSLSPFSVVALVSRIEGHLTVPMVQQAIDKARRRHPLLGTRIELDDQGDPWFTTEGAGAIPVETLQRETDDQWIEVVVRERKVAFDFAARPPMRVILVQSDTVTEMIILCHHIICDGLSLAYLVRDLLMYMGAPERSADQTLDPVPVDEESLPTELSLNKVARYFVGRINRKWHAEKVIFDQQDYADLSKAYWRHYDHRCLSIELTEEQTDQLVSRCRANDVTVNSALAAAFAGAQVIELGQRAYNPKLAVAVSLRNRLTVDVGEAMGFYAGASILDCRYRATRDFWRNVRRFQKAIRSRLGDRHVLQDHINWCYLDPTILEAVNYKKLGHLTAPEQPSYDKLAAFANRDDVVARILKRDGQLALDRVTVGTAITNLTRLEFATIYGSLQLDRIMMVPGGAFPLVNCGLVVGAVTYADKLSLTIEYAEQAVSTSNMQRVIDEAMALLHVER